MLLRQIAATVLVLILLGLSALTLAAQSPGGTYLPAVMREGRVQTPTPRLTPTAAPTNTSLPTSTPTATASPSPTRCNTSVQMVQNPSFETDWEPWATTDGEVFRVTCSIDGLYGLGFGGDNGEFERVTQELNALVPEWAETGAVYFSWLMASEDVTTYPYDGFSLQLWGKSQEGDTNVLHSEVYNTDNRAAWYTTRLAIPSAPALRGRPLRLALVAATDDSYPTWWCIDNVRVVFACGDQVP